MDREAWRATVHVVTQNGHNVRDLACMQHLIPVSLFSFLFGFFGKNLLFKFLERLKKNWKLNIDYVLFHIKYNGKILCFGNFLIVPGVSHIKHQINLTVLMNFKENVFGFRVPSERKKSKIFGKKDLVINNGKYPFPISLYIYRALLQLLKEGTVYILLITKLKY